MAEAAASSLIGGGGGEPASPARAIACAALQVPLTSPLAHSYYPNLIDQRKAIAQASAGEARPSAYVTGDAEAAS